MSVLIRRVKDKHTGKMKWVAEVDNVQVTLSYNYSPVLENAEHVFIGEDGTVHVILPHRWKKVEYSPGFVRLIF